MRKKCKAGVIIVIFIVLAWHFPAESYAVSANEILSAENIVGMKDEPAMQYEDGVRSILK